MDEVELLESLLTIYSPSYQEREVVDCLVAGMKDLGLAAFRDAAGNAVGIAGEGPREIVLLGHIDTAPGFIPVRREGDLVFARGAVDAKGPLCAFAAAAARVGAREGWRIVVVGAVEEECPTSKGAHFAAAQYRPEYAIVGEPSGWDRVTLGYKGSLWIDYTLSSPAAHTAGQQRSAPEEAVEFWLAVKRLADEFNRDKSRVFERLDPTLRGMHSESDGLFERARLTVGLRLPVGVGVSELEEQVTRLAGRARLAFSTEVPAFQADKNNPLVRAFLNSIRDENGKPGFTLKTGTSDMNVVGPQWRCPIVTYGPGDSNLDHTPDEHIDLSEYRKAINVLERVLNSLIES